MCNIYKYCLVEHIDINIIGKVENFRLPSLRRPTPIPMMYFESLSQ